MDTIPNHPNLGANSDHPFDNAQFNPSSSNVSQKSYFEPQRTVIETPALLSGKPFSKNTSGVQVFGKGNQAKAQFNLPKKKSRKKVLIGMLISILILAGGAVGFSIYYFNQPSKAAVNPETTPTNQITDYTTLKENDLVKFGDEATTFKVKGKIWLDNLSHPKEATKAYVYLESVSGGGSTIKTLKAGDRITFNGQSAIYVVDKFEFNLGKAEKSTRVTIVIHEINKSATTLQSNTSAGESTTKTGETTTSENTSGTISEMTSSTETTQ